MSTTVLDNARSPKNQSIVRTLTELKIILSNEIRWSGVRLMIDRFLCIHHELSQLAQTSNTFELGDKDVRDIKTIWKRLI